jgi:hypothetical protein
MEVGFLLTTAREPLDRMDMGFLLATAREPLDRMDMGFLLATAGENLHLQSTVDIDSATGVALLSFDAHTQCYFVFLGEQDPASPVECQYVNVVVLSRQGSEEGVFVRVCKVKSDKNGSEFMRGAIFMRKEILATHLCKFQDGVRTQRQGFWRICRGLASLDTGCPTSAEVMNRESGLVGRFKLPTADMFFQFATMRGVCRGPADGVKGRKAERNRFFLAKHTFLVHKYGQERAVDMKHKVINITAESQLKNVNFHEVVSTTGNTLPSMIVDELPSELSLVFVDPTQRLVPAGVHLYREILDALGGRVFTYMVASGHYRVNDRVVESPQDDMMRLDASSENGAPYNWAQWILPRE